MDVEHKDMKKLFWQITTILGLIILFISPLTDAVRTVGMKFQLSIPSIITSINASEIYPMFTCPCCGKPLDKDNPCCGSATQMIDFIDQKISTGATKDNIILATAQEFGLERFADQSQSSKLREKLLANAPKNAPKITVTETKRDLGTVSLKKGIVTTEFVIKNDGKSELIINKLSSSCGCTSASLIYQGKEGPRFYMAGHGQEEPDPNWKVIVAPGDEARVKIYYDPSVHPDLIGAATRTVSVHSNDPVDFETKFTVFLDQQK